MEYLKAPIGDDQFVHAWLNEKIKTLKKIVSLLSSMPHKHEAATLLRSTAAVCRVVYLMRILPPLQTSAFIVEFDTVVRSGFEEILGISMNDLWWEIAKLPAKYGGMGWKTGSHVSGAHYIASLAKTFDSVVNIIPDHDAERIAKRDAAEWLQNFAPPNVTVESMIRAIRNPRNPKPNLSAINLSTAQQCDEWHWQKLVPRLSDRELIHVLANSGPTNWWVSCPP